MHFAKDKNTGSTELDTSGNTHILSAAVGWKLYLNINVLFEAARQNRTLHKAILLETICKLVLLAKRYQCWQGVGEERQRVTRQKRNFLRNNPRELRRPEVLPHPFCTPRGDFSCGSRWWVQLSLYSAALLKIFWKLPLQLQKLPKTAERQLTHWRFKSPLEDPGEHAGYTQHAPVCHGLFVLCVGISSVIS